jgi:hypothetical protein
MALRIPSRNIASCNAAGCMAQGKISRAPNFRAFHMKGGRYLFYEEENIRASGLSSGLGNPGVKCGIVVLVFQEHHIGCMVSVQTLKVLTILYPAYPGRIDHVVEIIAVFWGMVIDID